MIFALALAIGCRPRGPDEERPASTQESTLPDKVPAVQVSDWCDAVTGPPGQRAIAVDLSHAHTSARLFGPDADWPSADARLVSLLSGEDPFTDGITTAYAQGLTEACDAPATDLDPPASISMRGGVALVVPGPGALSLPEGTDVVAIDLRAAPNATFEEVTQAAALAVDGRKLGEMRVRRFEGWPDQLSGGSLYNSALTEIILRLDGDGADLPLFIFTPQRLSPGASRAAAALRLRKLASVVGYDLHARVSESTWAGVSQRGLALRSAELFDHPDVISAEVSASDPEAWLHDLVSLPEPGPPSGLQTREPLQPFDPLAAIPATANGRASQRAALLVLHGTLERFFPYFDEVGYRIDDALLAALSELQAIDEDDREAFLGVMGRMLHEIDDGHAFYGDPLGAPRGATAAQIQQIDGEAIVRASAHEGLSPGDAVVSIDGVPAFDWLSEVMARSSAATDGYRFDLAARELLSLPDGERVLELRDPGGAVRTVTVEDAVPGTLDDVPFGGTFQPSGWLDDDIYYLNLNPAVTTNTNSAVAQISALSSSDASLIVDVRDYPVVDAYEVARWLNSAPYTSPLFDVPVREGPELEAWERSFYPFIPEPGAFTGPIVWLVSNKTVSAAENFSQMVASQPNVTVVGQNSAATNGNITGMWLPGRFYSFFTGMKVSNPDGSTFHGVGIAVDIEVQPTQSDFAAGRDRELQAAIDWLSP